MAKPSKIKISNMTFEKSQHVTEYRSTRIKRNVDGTPVLDHGRPESEDIMEVRNHLVYKAHILIDGEWYDIKSARREFGKKQVRRAIKKYVDEADDKESLMKKLGK